MERLGVVVVAAGKGSRMQSTISKQFMTLKDKPILVHTIEVFERMREVAEIVIVTGAADIERVNQYKKQYNFHKIKTVVPGGADRQDSVYEGLKAISDKVEWVLIHDGVRPLISQEAIKRVWAGARRTGAAVLAVPVKDTIKQVSESGEIIATPQRTSLRAIQTPQAFRRSVIQEAYEQAKEKGWQGTDDASFAEYMGHSVMTIEGDYRNLKITTPEDLAIAEILLQAEADSSQG